MTPRLLKTTQLVIKSKNTDGSWDDSGNWVEGTSQADRNIYGSLQPFRKGTSRVELPEGITAQDSRIFYTQEPLKSASEYTNQEADIAVINGINYLCWHVEDWTTHNLKSNNYKNYLIREDKI